MASELACPRLSPKRGGVRNLWRRGKPMRRGICALAIASTLVALAGCATRTTAPEETGKLAARYARYAEYAGPPIRQFTWLGQFYSWEALGKDKLVVFTTPSDAYLLKVWPNCDMRWVS